LKELTAAAAGALSVLEKKIYDFAHRALWLPIFQSTRWHSAEQ
jgi:hypothetical protein